LAVFFVSMAFSFFIVQLLFIEHNPCFFNYDEKKTLFSLQRKREPVPFCCTAVINSAFFMHNRNFSIFAMNYAKSKMVIIYFRITLNVHKVINKII
jgi:hypothetical protein